MRTFKFCHGRHFAQIRHCFHCNLFRQTTHIKKVQLSFYCVTSKKIRNGLFPQYFCSNRGHMVHSNLNLNVA